MCSVNTIQQALEIRSMDADDLIINKQTLISLLEENFRINFQSGDACAKEAVDKYSDMLRFYTDHTAILLGAFSEDVLLGFLWAYPREQLGELRMHIAHIIMLPDYRSCGIGKRLLDTLEKIAKEQGIRKFELWTTVGNARALKFYKSNGFMIARVQFEKELEQLEC